MARITVEDCLQVIPNKYKLVILASQRATELFSGIASKIDANDENGVKALREIALSKIDPENLEEKLINSYRQMPEATISQISDDEVDATLEAIKKEMEGITDANLEASFNDAGFEVK